MTDVETDQADDLRAALDSAWTETGGDAAAPAPGATPAPGVAAVADPAEGAAGATRDQNGRFLPKPAAAATTADGTAAAGQVATPSPAGASTGDPPADQPPAGVSPAVKAAWPTLAQDVKDDILKRERETAAVLEQRATQLKRFEPLEQVIGPHRERLALAGVDEGTYVRSLITADEMLRRPETRLQAIAQIAQGYGIDLRVFGNGQAQPQQAQQPHPYDQRLSTIEQQLAQQRTNDEQAVRSQSLQAVETFRNDPAHLYFENVKGDMAALIKSGQAADLKDAYEKAIWSRPDIRPLLLQAQATTAAAQAQTAARAKADQARQASGSVTGSPGAGASPLNGHASSEIRDQLYAAWDA